MHSLVLMVHLCKIDDIQAGAAGFDQTFAGATQAGSIADPKPDAVFMGMVQAVMQCKMVVIMHHCSSTSSRYDYDERLLCKRCR